MKDCDQLPLTNDIILLTLIDQSTMSLVSEEDKVTRIYIQNAALAGMLISRTRVNRAAAQVTTALLHTVDISVR